MTIEQTTEYEPSAERLVAGYDDYRRIVDELNPAFRTTGIVDPEGYERAMQDPRTVKLTLAGNVELPFLTPLEYVWGYESERCRQLTGRQDVRVLSLPLWALTAQAAEIAGGSFPEGQASLAIIVETEHSETAQARDLLPDLIAPPGMMIAQDFLDTRIRNPEAQPATMSMYESGLAAVDQYGELRQTQGMDFISAYRQLQGENHPLLQHTKLLDPHMLEQDEDLAHDLWALCKDRFDWLGAYHPVYMEDTKDFFMQTLMDEHTHTLVRYDDDKPVCLGMFMFGLSECIWLKQAVQQDIEQRAVAQQEQVVYFYGLAGQPQAHYSQDIMRSLSDIGQRMGGSYRMVFESTNMSSRYIPRLIGQYLGEEGSGLRMTEPVHKTAQIDYWYLAPSAD